MPLSDFPLFPLLNLRSAGLPRGHPSPHFANLEEGRKERQHFGGTELCRVDALESDENPTLNMLNFPF